MGKFQPIFKELIEIQKLIAQKKVADLAQHTTLIENRKKELIEKVSVEVGEKGTERVKQILGEIKQTTSALPLDAKKFGKHFDLNKYNSLLNFTKLAYLYDTNGDPAEQALKLSVVFNHPPAALEYLADYAKTMNNEGQLIHDACLFQLPDVTTCSFEVWKTLANKTKNMHLAEFRNLLPHASELEALIVNDSKSGKKRDHTAIIKKEKELAVKNKRLKTLKRHHGTLNDNDKTEYQNLIQEIMSLNIELSRHYAGTRLSEANLTMLKAYAERYKNEAVPGYKYFIKHGLTKQDYNKFINLIPANDDQQIPNILIDGAQIGYPGFYLKKIDVLNEEDAARAACLGKLTHCCQSLSGEAGEPCVIYGLTSPNSGFYVLCKGNANNPQIEDEVYAQSWVWRSQSNGMVIDSVESGRVAENEIKMASDFYRYLSHQLVSTPAYNISK